jgi:DNA-3-methyladenine glycosylase
MSKKQTSAMGMLRHHQRKSGARQETIWSNQPFDFDGPTVDVAQRLVGALIVRRIPSGKPHAGMVIVARIVETEAYLPLVDPACHAYRGPTARNASVFGRPGTAYVYFIYGAHHCLNVVTERPGIGAAVLIRAAEALEGFPAMRERRPGAPDAALTCGPGNLCRALDIDRAEDGADLRNGDLRVVAAARPASSVESGPRIGITAARGWPLRFVDAGSASISPYRRRSERESAAHLVDGHARGMV